jgi:hypothetical protein
MAKNEKYIDALLVSCSTAKAGSFQRLAGALHLLSSAGSKAKLPHSM